MNEDLSNLVISVINGPQNLTGDEALLVWLTNTGPDPKAIVMIRMVLVMCCIF